jgi:hypothetical protein
MKDTDLGLIKECHDDGKITVNNNDYILSKSINHLKRLKVFGYLSKVQNNLSTGDMSFLGTKEHQEIEKLINSIVMFNDMTIDKLPQHWDENAEDYILFITTALMVISYPFLKGLATS